MRDAGPGARALDIRALAADDLDAITAIYAHAVLHGTASFELDPPARAEMQARSEALRAGGYPYLVAVEDGEVVGYAYAGPYRSRPAYRGTVENSVYIRADREGRGVGRRLLAALVDDCTARGFRQMVAVIGGSGHQASIRLHERAGFTQAGVLRAVGWKHGRWLDSVLMQRALGEGSATPPPGH